MVAPNKASIPFDKCNWAELPAPDRILFLLKTRGRNSTAALARALRITGEAARQQLVRLEAQGLVQAAEEIRGRGRPRQLWTLTPAANRRFPDSHPELTAQLLETIRQTLGERALERVIQARGEELVRNYTFALKDAPNLRDRIERLASLRNAEGYMAECRAQKGGYLLIENHCPICAASGICANLCRSELELFSRLLGPKVTVQREEHMVEGSRRCVYRIRQAAAEPTRSRTGASANDSRR